MLDGVTWRPKMAKDGCPWSKSTIGQNQLAGGAKSTTGQSQWTLVKVQLLVKVNWSKSTRYKSGGRWPKSTRSQSQWSKVNGPRSHGEASRSHGRLHRRLQGHMGGFKVTWEASRSHGRLHGWLQGHMGGFKVTWASTWAVVTHTCVFPHDL